MHIFIKLIIAIAVSHLAGILGSFATMNSVDTWYAFLVKPEFNPPNWLFGPVWLLLYTLMGIAAYLVWQQGWSKKQVREALILFVGHLVLNAAWSIFFFGWHMVGLALIDIVVVWMLIIVVMWKFGRIDKRAAYLLVPYLAWVSFATVLNYSIWILN